MNNGEKIASLRKAKGMTQAELGTELNVTFQAVSKWERGESYPDFDTMSRLAKLFGVPLSYFENDENGETAATAESAQEPAPAPAPKVMLGVCKECGKTVYEGEEATTEPALVCKKCVERKKVEAKRAAEEADKRRKAAEQAKLDETHKIRNRGLIWSGAIIGVITVLCIIGLVADLKGRRCLPLKRLLVPVTCRVFSEYSRFLPRLKRPHKPDFLPVWLPLVRLSFLP